MRRLQTPNRPAHTVRAHAPRRWRLKPLTRAIAAVGLLASPLWLQAAAPAPGTLPNGLQVVVGQATVQTQGQQMTVRNSPGAILNWSSFNIGAAAGVYFDQANAASKVLNRVTGQDPTQIFGSLASNGQVWLLNPNGVLFGQGARVDVAGLVASTLRLNDHDFIAGRYRLGADAGSTAVVRNEGSIRTAHGGQVVLLGAKVDNRGSVEAPGGNLTLAAVQQVELVDTGLPHLAVRVEVPAGEALNLGRLVADGGSVDVFGAIVNQQGLVQADTLAVDAQGRITLKAGGTLMLGGSSLTQARGLDAGSRGGQVDLLGTQVGLDGQATVDASGVAAGGGIRVGGGVQGRDASVSNSQALWFGPQAVIRADATGDSGQGGQITLWSDAATRAYGTLSARGGRLAGAGGFVETSGGWLDARPARVDVSSRSGQPGQWLLDPNDILITSSGNDTNVSGGPNFTSTNDSSVITTATLAAALNSGSSVSVTTASAGGNSQPGDILMDNATLNVAPGQPVTLTLNAARDIVVRDSSITSTASPLSLTLNAAGSGVGAIEVLRSAITTAGGDVTLQGTLSQTLTLPDGSSTAQTYRPAVGYLAGSLPSITSRGGSTGVSVQDSTLNLGTGTFKATGYTTVANADALFIGSVSNASTQINAGQIDLFGLAFVANPVGVDLGTLIAGNATDLVATTAFRAEGNGTAGLEVSDGARLSLNAVTSSGASMTLVGRGSTDHGVILASDNISTGTAGRGSSITVGNAALNVTADATQTTALLMFNNAGAPGPLLNLAGATAASFNAPRSGNGAFGDISIVVNGVDLVLPANGATSFVGNRPMAFTLANLDGGGSLSMAAAGIRIQASNISSSGQPWNIDFATTGANPEGVAIANSNLITGNGDVRFGAVQNVSSAVLGSTSAAAPWLEYAGTAGTEALELDTTLVDAGSGRISGGGANRGSGVASGVSLIESRLSAREIKLAGRSDSEIGLLVSGSTLIADRVLDLDGLSAGGAANSGAGLFVSQSLTTGSVLQLVDPNTTAGSELKLTGGNINSFAGVILSGGDAGSSFETRLVVSGAALNVQGTTNGNSSGTGLALVGTSAQPGGLLLNTLGATGVTLRGITSDSTGTGLSIQFSNVLGPQATNAAPLLIRGNGTQTGGTPGTSIDNSTITTGGTLTVQGDGLNINSSGLTGENGVSLLGNTGAGAPAAAPILLRANIITATAPGAVIRVEGTAGDAVPGDARFQAGTGVTMSNGNGLQSTGAGGSIVVQGRGATAGGAGVSFINSPMVAESISITGTGVVDGHGIFSEDFSGGLQSSLTAKNVTLTGVSANNASTPDKAGVRLSNGSALVLSGRGNVTISGDTAVLGGTAAGQPFAIGGDAATVTVATTDSMQLRNTTWDFTSGTGTNVNLQADSDATGGGRVRLQGSTLRTGGGHIAGAGTGVRRNPSTVPQNSTVLEGAVGMFLINSTLDAGSGNITLSGTAPNDGQAVAGSAGSTGLAVQGAAALTGSVVSLTGNGGDIGMGIDVGQTVAGSTLAITASQLQLTGTGVGINPGNSTAYAGLSFSTASTWNVTGAATLTSLGGGIGIDGGLALTAGSIQLLTPVAAPAPVFLGGISLTATDTSGQIRASASNGTAATGDTGIVSGVGVTVVDSTLTASGSAGSIHLNGAGAASGGSGLVFARSVFQAPSISLSGAGSVVGDGVSGEDLTGGALSRLTATHITINGTSADNTSTPAAVGVRLGANVQLNFATSGGTGLVAGDTVLLGNIAGTGPAFSAVGSPASFSVRSSGSQRVVNSSLNFLTAGSSGTVINLEGDSDRSNGGRVRLENSLLQSGGADINISGEGEVRNASTPPQNLSVREGSIGVFVLGSTLSMGSGTARITGSGPVTGAAQGSNGGNSGVGFQGVNSIVGGVIRISGDGGDFSRGVEMGVGDPNATLTLQANDIAITGRGTGVDPSTLLPYAGLEFASTVGSGWTVLNPGTGLNAAPLTLTSTAGPLLLNNVTASTGRFTATAAGALSLAGSSVTAADSAQLTATGTSQNGSLLSTSNSTVQAGGTLQLSGTASDSGVGVMLLDGTALSGSSVSLTGQSAGGPGLWLRSTAGSHTVQATSGALSLVGRAAVNTSGVRITGGWQLQSATTLLLDASEAPAFEADSGGTVARLLTGTDTTIRLAPSSTIALGATTAARFTTVLQSLPAAGKLTWEVGGSSSVSVNAALTVPGRMTFQADQVLLQPGALLQASGAGDALVFRGQTAPGVASFNNSAGASPLSTPNGRWVLLGGQPSGVTLGGLQADFTAYNLAAQPWSLDANGNYLTPGTGNALGYANSATALSGLLTKVYDATTSITLNPLTWTITGLNAGDTLNFSGSNLAALPDKNVGTARPVTLGATSFSVQDSNGRPVFGYATPVFSANVTPLAVAVTGTAVASKTYDAGTSGSFSSLGSVTPLAGDVLGVGGAATAVFSDKNVGNGKTVAIGGLVLTGADAGNYSLVAPATLTANITPLGLAVTGVAAQSRAYDAGTVATLSGTAAVTALPGDAVSLGGTPSASFADKNVGSGKPVTVAGYAISGADAGNYTLAQPVGLTASITPLGVTLAGLTAQAKVYDTTTSAAFSGTPSVAALPGDSLSVAGTAVGQFGNKNAGTAKPVTLTGLALAGTDAGNYTLVLPAYTANIAPASLGLLNVAAAGKTYDGNRTAAMSGTLTGVLPGDTVNLGLTGQFASANVGAAQVVTWNAATSGADAGNYVLAPAIGAVQASITPATLTYTAAPAVGTLGQPLPVLTGQVSGFVGGDTLSSATTGSTTWTSAATSASAVGSYAITGGGLVALNYVFVQAAGNATALTLQAPSTADAATTSTNVVTTAALLSVQLPVTMSTPTQGRVLDVTTAFAPAGSAADGMAFRSSSNAGAEGGPAAAPNTNINMNTGTATNATTPATPASSLATTGSGGDSSSTSGSTAATATGGSAAPAAPLSVAQGINLALRAAGEAADGIAFRALDLSRLPREEVQSLLAARARYKQKVFSKGVYRLQQDPTLADVRACRSETELDTGACIVTEQLKQEIQAARQRLQQASSATRTERARRGVKVAALPVIQRKLALVVGINRYNDRQIPELMGSIPDARAVRQILDTRMGYETTVLENASREQIVRAFNKLALEAETNDSVIIYYAGHGVLVPVEGVETGYWLPSDVDAEVPSTWLSNADIARMVAAVGAQQVMLVSDSCYSGQLVGKDRVQLGRVTDATELLKRRAAVVMSSGGDEPVADQGREGHSVFAWHFMRALEGLDQWQVGGSLYERIRAGVVKDFPQTPQYGASRGAGHQGNTDYLFERRELEAIKP